MTDRDWRLAPPAEITAELFDRSRDVNGNPTAHYQLFWNNAREGSRYQSGRYRTRRRVQVGCRDKITGGAFGLAEDLFPGAAWTLEPGSVEETRDGERATFTLTRDWDNDTHPVIFRLENWNHDSQDPPDGPRRAKPDWRPVAVFPTLCGTNESDVTCYAHAGQHATGDRGWYRTTRPATDEQAAPLKRELEGRGYRLEVVKRWTPAHDAKRAEEYRAQRGVL